MTLTLTLMLTLTLRLQLIYLKYCPYYPGMVERCHRTIEDVIRKVISKQTDWVKMLNSVLFSVRSQVHSSTGFSPMRMLFNKDPILPFQYADQMENCPDAESDMSNPFSTKDQDVNSFSIKDEDVNPFSTKDPVVDMVEKLELQRTAIFDKAGSKIAKAQKIYARSYNNKYGAGIQFKVGDKCLRRNKQADSHKAKLKKYFTGPYEIMAISKK